MGKDKKQKIEVRVVNKPDDIRNLRRGMIIDVIQHVDIPSVGYHSVNTRRGMFDKRCFFGGFYAIEKVPFSDGTYDFARIKYRLESDDLFYGDGALHSKRATGKLREQYEEMIINNGDAA